MMALDADLLRLVLENLDGIELLRCAMLCSSLRQLCRVELARRNTSLPFAEWRGALFSGTRRSKATSLAQGAVRHALSRAYREPDVALVISRTPQLDAPRLFLLGLRWCHVVHTTPNLASRTWPRVRRSAQALAANAAPTARAATQPAPLALPRGPQVFVGAETAGSDPTAVVRAVEEELPRATLVVAAKATGVLGPLANGSREGQQVEGQQVELEDGRGVSVLLGALPAGVELSWFCFGAGSGGRVTAEQGRLGRHAAVRRHHGAWWANASAPSDDGARPPPADVPNLHRVSRPWREWVGENGRFVLLADGEASQLVSLLRETELAAGAVAMKVAFRAPGAGVLATHALALRMSAPLALSVATLPEESACGGEAVELALRAMRARRPLGEAPPEPPSEPAGGDATYAAAHSATPSEPLPPPGAALLFTCNGRGAEFHAGDAGVESAAVSRVLPGVPIVGMFSNGEVGPTAQARTAAGASGREPSRVAFQSFAMVLAMLE